MKNLKKFVYSLSLIEWTWRLEEVHAVMMQLGLVEVKRVSGRNDYQHECGWELNVYHENSECFAIEINLEVFLETDSLDIVAYHNKRDEFYHKFMYYTKELESVIGKPAFSDGAAARGFPHDQEAAWLSLWKVQNARLMIQQKHEDRELPFRVVLVIAP